jgi:pyruvate formate lyase activating enzyme
MAREAQLYQELAGGRVRCTACARYCNIPEGKIGFCGIRQNLKGKLYLLAYGKITASHVDPIEKKPLTHYLPGTQIFSISTTGCSWSCSYCQNYDMSQRRTVEGTDVTPEQIVRLAEQYGCQSIAYTYNEPIIFLEFAHDVGVLARKQGLHNAFVSNGYATPDAVKMMNDFLDAITVDFKGNGETTFLRRNVGIPNADPVYRTLLDLKSAKIHIEITDLVVPGIGDNLQEARKLSRWIYENLGPDTPTHFLRFHPDFKLSNLPSTPVETLERHHEVAKAEGLKYVYLGNVPGHPFENTYCAGCGAVVVRRYGFDITGWYLDKNNSCLSCGEHIPIVGTLSQTVRNSRFFPVMLDH